MERCRLTQTQSEAIIWLLLVAKYIDSHISLAECKIFNRQLAELPWSSPISIYKVADRLTANVRIAIENDSLLQYRLKQFSHLFDTTENREFALQEVISILEVDGLTDTKDHFIQRIRSTFGIEETVTLST